MARITPCGPVWDDEVLYRSVKHDVRVPLVEQQENDWVVSSGAFLDPRYQPSVDRAELRNKEPAQSLRDGDYCVVQVLAEEVRKITGVVRYDGSSKRTVKEWTVDIQPDPVLEMFAYPPYNPAHAVITCRPELADKIDKKPFEKLRAELARMSRPIYPSNLFGNNAVDGGNVNDLPDNIT